MENMPRWAKVFLIVVLPIVLIGAFYFLFYKPKSKEIKRLKAEITKQENEIRSKETKVKRLPELKKQYQTLKAELEVLQRQLPEEKEVSELLKQVSDLGIKAGLIIKLWKPEKRGTHSSGLVYTIPVRIEMDGSYHELGKFFSSLTQLDRIVNIENFRLTNARFAGNVARIDIAMKAVTFSSIPEEEIQKKKKAQKKRKK